MLAAKNTPKNNTLHLMLDDIYTGIVNWRIWMLLGLQDIKLRYRRSQLGPFWITISMAIIVYSMGFLYSKLFHLKLEHYFPFLATGILTWSYISTVLNEMTNAFMESSPYIKQIKLPYSVYVLRIIVRNLIIMAHNSLAILPILLFFHVNFFPAFLFLFFSITLLVINSFFYGLILGILGARFRDIAQIITNLIQVIFFMTPIMWLPSILPKQYQVLIDFNPIAQFIDIIRQPLLGQFPSEYSLMVTGLITISGIIIALLLFYRVRHRIIYWL